MEIWRTLSDARNTQINVIHNHPASPLNLTPNRIILAQSAQEQMEQHLLCQPAAYKGFAGQIYLYPSKIRFLSSDGRSVTTSLLSIQNFIVTSEDSGDPAISITNQSGKVQIFAFLPPDAKENRDAFLKLARTAQAHLFDIRNQVDNGKGEQLNVVPKTLPEKRAFLLATKPELRMIYENLVEKERIITEDEFWDRHSEGLKEISNSNAEEDGNIGISSSLVTEIVGEPVLGETSVEYTLNSEMIHDIFVHLPAVRKAYDALVPDKFSEEQFWTNFFRSAYFHRKAQGKSAAHEDPVDQKKLEEDIFFKYEDAQEANSLSANSRDQIKAIRKRALHRTVDLTRDDTLVFNLNSDENLKMEKAINEKFHKSAKGIIEKINDHGDTVLNSSNTVNAENATESPQEYHTNLSNSLSFKDLEDENDLSHHLKEINGGSFDFLRDFINAPLTQEEKARLDIWLDLGKNDISSVSESRWASFERDQTLTKSCVEKLSAEFSSITRASQFGKTRNPTSLLIFSKDGDVDVEVPRDMSDKLKAFVLKTEELLSHFWSCVPPQQANSTAGKFLRMGQSLRDYSAKMEVRILLFENPLVESH